MTGRVEISKRPLQTPTTGLTHFRKIQDKALARLYAMEMHGDGGKILLADIDIFSEGLRSRSTAIKALRGLSNEGLVFIESTKLTAPQPASAPIPGIDFVPEPKIISREDSYEITPAGLAYAESKTVGDPDFQRLIATSILWKARFQRDKDVPATDRFVSVKDNQTDFGEVSSSLTEIKNQFALDHNKRDLPLDHVEARTAEIEAFENLMASGWVSERSAKEFLTTLRYIKKACNDFKEISLAASVAIAAISKIFGLL